MNLCIFNHFRIQIHRTWFDSNRPEISASHENDAAVAYLGSTFEIDMCTVENGVFLYSYFLNENSNQTKLFEQFEIELT